MELLHGAVRRYAWGSRTAIADLLGTAGPSPHPQAELWFGAHAADPSRLGGGGTLLEAVAADADRQVGPAAAARWGPRLPFLLKVLAAEEPLSLQAHPSAAQAAEGYAREEALGIPLGAPERNYSDPHHKPELVCALTEFAVLAGFREPARTVELLTAIDAPELVPYRELLARQPDADGLRALFTTWITLPQQAIDAVLPPVLDACVAAVRRRDPFAPECRTLLQLAEAHPGDVGVLGAVLLDRIVLAPGEALHIPAGSLHTYLHGMAVEIMANSDNVLRGGLTPKHVDVPELLRILDFGRGELPVLRGEGCGQRETSYDTPAREFRLSRLDWPAGDVQPVPLATGDPQVLLCTSGDGLLCADGGRELPVRRGAAAWLAAADPAVTVRPGSDGLQLFRATCRPGA